MIATQPNAMKNRSKMQRDSNSSDCGHGAKRPPCAIHTGGLLAWSGGQCCLLSVGVYVRFFPSLPILQVGQRWSSVRESKSEIAVVGRKTESIARKPIQQSCLGFNPGKDCRVLSEKKEVWFHLEETPFSVKLQKSIFLFCDVTLAKHFGGRFVFVLFCEE